MKQFTGNPSDYGWEPHKPKTWTHRFAKTRHAITMQHYEGRWDAGGPVMRNVLLPALHVVKIVMVSRMGDVGITEDLTAETGYGARLLMSDLCDYQEHAPGA